MKNIFFNRFTGQFVATLAATAIGTPLGLYIWNNWDELASFAKQHFPTFMIVVVIIALVAFYIVGIILYTRLAISTLRRIVERQMARKRLIELTRDIYELRRIAVARYDFLLRSVEVPERLSNQLEERWQSLTESLSDLDIPYPETSTDYTLEDWGVPGKCISYLEYLSQITVNGDLYRARRALKRINNEGIENFWTRLGRNNFWRRKGPKASQED